MKKSHNDYWTGNTYLTKWIKDFFGIKGKKLWQVKSAIHEQCNIIEADVIYKKGKLFLSHSWRPAFLCYGKIDDYLNSLKRYSGKRLYFYIELKTDDYRIIHSISELMKLVKNEKITFLINGNNNQFWQGDREKVAKEIVDRNKSILDIEYYKDFEKKHQIESVDLWKSLPWYKKLNFF